MKTIINELGIESHRWGYYMKAEDKLISTCIAKTYYEAESYFDEIDLVKDGHVEIKIIQKLEP